MGYKIKPGTKGLIFDLDGTLVDSMPFHYEAWKRACSRLGLNLDTDYLRSQTGNSNYRIAEVIIRQNGAEGKITPSQIGVTKLEEYLKYEHLITPIEQVLAVAKEYHGIIPMAVGTGGPKISVERCIELTGLKEYFDIVVCADDVKNHKPHPETFLKCADLMGVDPQYIEVFEDGDLGIEAALKAGMTPIDVRSWYKSDY
jgi:beta-phosphoglucomutase-like phosphatase (HAD superfamily)